MAGIGRTISLLAALFLLAWIVVMILMLSGTTSPPGGAVLAFISRVAVGSQVLVIGLLIRRAGTRTTQS